MKYMKYDFAMSDNNNFLKKYYEGVTQKLRVEIDYLNQIIGHTVVKGSANETFKQSIDEIFT